MSDPTPVTDLLDPLLRHVAERITPLFEIGGTNKSDARATAISALAAYNPNSQADFVNIARILAFSLASLAALGLAAAEDLPPAQKMRYFGRANALNRSADQSERIMMQRRRNQHANAPIAAASTPSPKAAITPQDEAALDAAVDEAMAAYRATTAAKAVAKSLPARPQPAPAQIPLGSAITAHRPAKLYRQTLLNGSAMPRVLGSSQPQPTPP